jgi:hypothetical protein
MILPSFIATVLYPIGARVGYNGVMHRLALRRVAVWAAVAWLMTILSAELLHFAIEESSQAAQRECPVCLFHSTHGQITQPETVLNPVLTVAWVELTDASMHYSLVLPAFPVEHSRVIRAPPVVAL